jgi:hypothetical protein
MRTYLLKGIAVKQIVVALLALVGAGGTPALAQSQADFVKAFSGKWQIYDQQAASGTALCELDFASTGSGSKLPVKVMGCRGPLASVQNWSIEGSQLVLADGQNTPVVKLGGNQKRVTGATAGGVPIVLERAGGDGNAATLQAAYNASCYYLGYTQTCAPRSELAVPAAGPDGRTQIQLQANLNVHSEPRADADVVGATKQGACVVVQQCTMASDGPWCEVKFGNVTGWLRKLTMRQNRWPVVTFTNSCKP